MKDRAFTRRGVLGAVALAWLLACLPGHAAGDQEATIIDGAVGGGAGGSDFFYVAAINGTAVRETSHSLSRQASYGRGAYMTLRSATRQVPAGAVRLKLVGRRDYAAPIQSLFNAAASWAVDGEVDVTLDPGVTYHVNGMIDGFRREVWLERAGDRQVISKVASSAMSDPKVQAEMAGAAYTCCNLHYEDDWISDGNWHELPFVPAGARILVKDYGRHRAEVLIEGRKMRIGHDYGRGQESKEAFVQKLLTREDPTLKLAGYEPAIQAAVRASKVRIGMTREQVLMSIGPPRTDSTPSTEAHRWTYYVTDSDPFVVVWNEQWQVESVEAPDNIRALVLDSR